MAKELENIGNITSVGDLPQKMEEAEELKTEVETQIMERVRFSFYQFILIMNLLFSFIV